MVVNFQTISIMVVYMSTEYINSSERHITKTIGLCHMKIPIYIYGDFNAGIGSN